MKPLALMTLLMLATALPAAHSQAAGDPTRPPSAAEIRAFLGEPGVEPGTPALRLQSVLIAGERRVAIINGQRYRPGDEVNGAKIVVIEPGTVTLRSDDDTQTLTIDHRFAPVRDETSN